MNCVVRESLQPAFVLHTRPYRETSLLLEVFCEEGRIGLIAKGARRPRSHFARNLAPFVPLLLAWRGRSELFSLTHAERITSSAPLRGRALLCGFYLNELIVRLFERHDPCPRLFKEYAHSLESLACEEAPLEPILRRFEQILLAEIGYGLLLEEVESHKPIRAERYYAYFPERGPVPNDRAPPGAVVVSGRTLLALKAHDWSDPEVLGEGKKLLRHVLAYHLNDKPLYSRALFRSRGTTTVPRAG